MSRKKIIVFLDESDSAKTAFLFACKKAKNTNVPVEFINVVDDFSYSNPLLSAGSGEEKHLEAEKILESYADRAKDEFSILPGVLAAYGKIENVVAEMIKKDPSIGMIVIGYESDQKKINSILSKLDKDFMVPITIIPSNLTESQISSLLDEQNKN